MIRRLLFLLALVIGAPAMAQANVDPTRLAAAQRVIEQVFPASQRDATIEAMVRPMMDNMTQAFSQSPELKKVFEDKPGVQRAFQAFIAGEQERSVANLKSNMPLLMNAMARAYARRFSSEQIADIARFFDTPSGRAYVAQSLTMMSDPDIQAAQRTMMAQSLDGMQKRLITFMDEAKLAKGAKQ